MKCESQILTQAFVWDIFVNSSHFTNLLFFKLKFSGHYVAGRDNIYNHFAHIYIYALLISFSILNNIYQRYTFCFIRNCLACHLVSKTFQNTYGFKIFEVVTKLGRTCTEYHVSKIRGTQQLDNPGLLLNYNKQNWFLLTGHLEGLNSEFNFPFKLYIFQDNPKELGKNNCLLHYPCLYK